MIRVFFGHTQALNGGYGVLGKGIKKMLEDSPHFELVGYQEQVGIKNVDLLLTYGMPDVIDYYQRINYKKHVHYMVWESSELPPEMIKEYQKADLVLTASKYHQRQFKKQGFETKVWNHGIDTRWQYREPQDDGVFTFLHHNAYEFRKGWEYVLEAFTSEFTEKDKVHLIMKARERKESVWLSPKEGRLTESEWAFKRDNPKGYLEQRLKIQHPQITELIGHLTDEEMVHMNAKADCFVAPAKGEGWSLPPFEAMAMGIVPIIPEKGCFTEWLNRDCMLTVRSNGYLRTSPRYPGHMYSVSVRDLRKKMRWVYENQGEIKRMGRIGSEYIHNNFNWNKIGNDLYKLVT